MITIVGDVARISSILSLIYQIHKNGVRDISYETQDLYILIFITRYLDMMLYFHHIHYALLKKVFLLIATIYIRLTLNHHHHQHQQQQHQQHQQQQQQRHHHHIHSQRVVMNLSPVGVEVDRTEYMYNLSSIIFPCLALATLAGVYESRPFQPTMIELCYTFSIFLESVALIPQLTHLYYTPRMKGMVNERVDDDEGEELSFHTVHMDVMEDTKSTTSMSTSTSRYYIFMYVYCIGIFRGIHLWNWSWNWILFSKCLDNNKQDEWTWMSLICYFYKEEVPINVHHMVIFICGLIQLGSIIYFIVSYNGNDLPNLCRRNDKRISLV